MGNEYSVKSLQWYSKAQGFNDMINSRGLKNKIIFMTHGNDLLLVCAASNNPHENSHLLLILRALYLT